MDTLRNHIASFVQMYNTHPIRKQVQREFYLPAGKPNMMYHYPNEGIRNYATTPDPTILDQIETQLSWFDETAYLAPATRALCDDITLQSRIQLDRSKIKPGLDQPHTELYKVLREKLFRIEQAGGVVEELQPPIGALSTIDKMVERFNIEGNTAEIEVIQVDNPLGEMEVDLSEEDEAQNDGSDVEFGDDGVWFEP
jgi:hypothetical protein